jgi:CheY-like chemotaxis protein
MRNFNATILVVDDDPKDLRLTEHALRHAGVTSPIHLCHSGEEAIAYMMGEGKYADRTEFPYPTFIITDLKMQGMDGFAVLEHLRDNPQWAVIPTVVFSASEDLDDIKRSYMLGASSYHVKPSGMAAMRQQMKVLHDYWLTCEVPEVDITGKRLETDSHGKLGERFDHSARARSGASRPVDVRGQAMGLNGNEQAANQAKAVQTVLLVEDDENDIFFFRRALAKTGLGFELQVARDGQEAQDYLAGEGKFGDRALFPFPKFILTDDAMPKVTGATFLKWLKAHPKFHVVPTIMLTGLLTPQAVTQAYQELGVHSFIAKPTRAQELEETLALIFKYWALCVMPPTSHEAEEASANGKPQSAR